MRPIVFHLPGDDAFPDRLVRALQAQRAALGLHRFPGGESLVRLDGDVTGRAVVLTCDTVPHASNEISVIEPMARAVEALMEGTGP